MVVEGWGSLPVVTTVWGESCCPGWPGEPLGGSGGLRRRQHSPARLERERERERETTIVNIEQPSPAASGSAGAGAEADQPSPTLE